MSNEHSLEVKKGERFEFGSNWSNFILKLDNQRIEEAKSSLINMLGVSSLEGKTFIDVGSGSGLFSLAARSLGAQVHSFDYDPMSVSSTKELKRRFFPNDPNWIVESGSVLDKTYLKSLGEFDIVYSWGVLHHTGKMWEALENVLLLARPGALLFIAIYNDQGGASRRWTLLKQLYNKHVFLRYPLIIYTLYKQWIITFIKDLIKGNPLKTWNEYKRTRGMSPWNDIVDWIGGYPFEVAKPEQIFDFYSDKGFSLKKMSTCAGGLGCNEFVFKKELN